MRIVRFDEGGGACYGVLEGDCLYRLAGEPFNGLRGAGGPLELHDVRLLAPTDPSKIVAVGLNYGDHAQELGMPVPDEPVLFLKAPSTVLAPGGKVVYPEQASRVDYEAEMALVMGRRARQVPESEACQYVFGYTCALDMTARNLQEKDGQWTRAKNFDTFCPLGPWVETDLDPGDLAITLELNGEVKQSSRTSQMIFGVHRLISFISGVMTLEPGDVILTGTPPGVGEVNRGDLIKVTIEGIGTLECAVA